MMTPVGALSVVCPFCRSAVGRPCTTRRGWLTVHHQRRAAWLEAERVEARLRAARAAQSA